MIESSPLPSLPPSRCVLGIGWLLALCLAGAGQPVAADTLGPSTTGRAYTPAPITVSVPELRQHTLAEAQKIATEAHVRLQVGGTAPADPSKAVVVRQTPEPKTAVAVGSVVTVIVQVPNTPATRPYGGGAIVRFTVVPDLLKRSLTEARPLVTQARLKLEVSGGEPEDTSHSLVVRQSPSAGTRVAPGSIVTVAVQLQRPEGLVTVPELRPRPLPDAQRLAASVKLKLEVSGGPPSDPSRSTVVTQKPPAGTRVPAGSSVVVTVQAPPAEELATVPDVRRQPLLEAQRRVSRARLRLEVAGGRPSDPLQAMVVEQKPAPQARVPFDTVVVVGVRPLATSPPAPPPAAPPQVVSPPLGVSPPRSPAEPGPVDEWTRVPALRQRPLMDALQRVRSARLRLAVTGGWPADPAHAVVFEQEPAQDTRVHIGSTVTVQISPPPLAVQPPPPPAPPAEPPAATPPAVAPVTPPAPPAARPPAPPASRPELVRVPDLRQQLLSDARQLTARARLALRVQGQTPTDETRAVVVGQQPSPGARVAVRSTVTVELGPALLAVPDLRDHPVDEARHMLSQAGFELAIMGEPPSDESRARVVEQAPLPGIRAAAGSTVTVRAKTSRLVTWIVAGAGALVAAGAAALGVARWRGVGSHAAPALPGVRVMANSDVGTQEISSNGAASDGFAIRLRSRLDGGTQSVDAQARIVLEERKADG